MNIPDDVIQRAQEAHTNELYRGPHSTDEDYSTKSYRGQFMSFVVIAEWMREKAAQIHENINCACDHEKQTGAPGGGAMGAVIQYRDEIRKIGEDGICNCGIVKTPHTHATPFPMTTDPLVEPEETP